MGEVTESLYKGERAIRMKFGPYEAVILPEIGGNLISFKDMERGLSFIREPRLEEMEEFTTYPVRHGIPVLFPPNRLQDGTFTVGERTYRFPINEEPQHNQLHGFLYHAAWTVESSGTTETASFVRMAVNVDEQHEAYNCFPHLFKFTLEYRLSQKGLMQLVDVHNLDETAIPFMLGFHTALNAPFSSLSTEDDYIFKATIGQRWELNDRMLPTGNFQPLNGGELRIPRGGINPFFEPMDNHYTAEPQQSRNYASVIDTRQGLRLVYEVGPKYKHWMIWNNNARGGFFCPEPQTCLVNAPNAPVSAEDSGLVLLGAGEHWTETSELYVESF